MRRFFTSLTFRIGVIIILVEIVVLAGLGSFYVNQLNKEIDDQLEYRVGLPGNLIEKHVLSYVTMATDQEILEELVGEELLDKLVVRANGEIITSLNIEEQGKYIKDLPRLNPDWFDPAMRESLLEKMPDGIVNVTPVRVFSDAEQASSFVYIKVDTAQTEYQKSANLWLFVGGSVATIAATSIAIILMFYLMITARVNKLLNMLKQVKAGDLGARVKARIWSDQIGTLQGDVNSMADQLQQTIETLESQVVERTKRLETVVEISRHLTSILDINTLLQQVVNNIQTAFAYYHVHIYLVNQETGELIMREGTGEIGRQLKAAGHKLRPGEGIVGKVVDGGQTFLTENVEETPAFVRNPLLPKTQSELAVPLRKGNVVLGVLDIQSEEIGGLREDDIPLMQAIADQIAVTVENARLFRQTQAATSQAEELNRRLTREAWQDIGDRISAAGYVFTKAGLTPVPRTKNVVEEWLPIMTQAVQHKDLTYHLGDGDKGDNQPEQKTCSVSIPLMLRDEVIGVIGIERAAQASAPEAGANLEEGEATNQNRPKPWTEDELTIIRNVSEQIALALDSARLARETQRAAWRDRVVGESIAKVWATSEIEEVMKAAVAQLGDKLRASEVVIRLGKADELLPE
ncbi:MAG: GAF domain-containing protein [Anaerolineae bacterium]|nr:GAF domain-containing protein [Anaerolineae bacterium]